MQRSNVKKIVKLLKRNFLQHPHHLHKHIQKPSASIKSVPTQIYMPPSGALNNKGRRSANNDDGVWRMPPEFLRLAPSLLGLCWGVIGLRIKPHSWQAWAPFVLPSIPSVSVVMPDDGIVVAGCPITRKSAHIGRDIVIRGEAFVRKHVRAVLTRARFACEALLCLPRRAAAAYPAEKYALRLLWICVIPRFSFVTRVCCPGTVEPLAEEFDDIV